MESETDHSNLIANRKHPEYDRLLPHWNFLEASYEGGREWFEANIFKYLKEGESEFKDRLKRAFRFNHTREVVDLVTKYLFKGEIARREDAPDEIREFWLNASRKGSPVEALMREGSRMSSVYGRPYLVVDSTQVAAEEGGAVSQADAKAAKARVYAYWVRPQDVMDLSVDDDGELNWILLRENERDDADFETSNFEVIERWRLWTRSGWKLYRRVPKSKGKKERIILEKSGENDLGFVPVFAFDDRESANDYYAPALIDDIAYLDRAAANYASNLDAIIQDQTFSQLVIPSQALIQGSATHEQVLEMGTKRIFAYDSDGGTKGPEYISPDVKQAAIILAVITKIITEIYHSVGMAGERTKIDASEGIDNSSGVAKSYDFDRINTLLKAKADRLADLENRVAGAVMAWHGKKAPADRVVTYPEEFDMRGLYDEFDIANRLALLGAPDELRRHQMAQLISKLFPQLTAEILAKVKAEMAIWPPEPVEAAPGVRDRSKPAAENKQGQREKTSQE